MSCREVTAAYGNKKKIGVWLLVNIWLNLPLKEYYSSLSKGPAIGHFDVALEEDLLGIVKIALCGCFDDATASFIGYFEVAQKDWVEIPPQNNPIVPFDTTPTKPHAQQCAN